MRISAYFYGNPGDPLDKACCSIFESHGGKSIGSGNMLIGPARGERDVEYNVPKGNVERCKDALKKAGYRLEPTPGKWDDGDAGVSNGSMH
jgi:hypothetical protein